MECPERVGFDSYVLHYGRCARLAWAPGA